MLKTNLISKAKSLFPAVLIAGFGVLGTYQAANAATFNFVGTSEDPDTSDEIYNYDLFIAPGEGVSYTDYIQIENVTGGAAIQTPDGWLGGINPNDQTIFAFLNGFDPNNAPITGGANGTIIPGFKIIADLLSEPGTGVYNFVDQNIGNTGGTSFAGNGTVTVPVASLPPTPIPESSSSAALLLIGGVAAASGLRKQFVKS